MGVKDLKSVKSSGGSNIPPMEAGTYPGRLVQVVELGLQKQRPYKGKEKQPRQEVLLGYEFADEFLLDEDGKEDLDKPRWLSEQVGVVGLDNDRAKLTKRYYALDPNEEKDGNLFELLGTPCMITVAINESNGKTYSNISAISTMREKDAKKLPELKNPPKALSLDEPDLEIFGSLPEWVQDKIKDAEDFKGSKLDVMLRDNVSEDDEEEQVQENEPEDEGEDW